MRKGRNSSNRLGADIAAPEFYKHFTMMYPDIKISRGQHSAMMDMALSYIRDYILGGGTWKMPLKMGTLRIIKYKQRTSHLRQNPAATVKYRKKIYFLNEHTGGYKYTHDWDKPKRLNNINIYNFTAIKAMRHKLRDAILIDKCDFAEKALPARAYMQRKAALKNKAN